MSSLVLMGIIDTIMHRVANLSQLLSSPVSSSLSPYLAVLGTFTYGMIWFMLSAMVYLKTDNPMSVVVMWLVFGVLYMAIFAQMQFIAQLFGILSALALTGMLYKLFVRR